MSDLTTQILISGGRAKRFSPVRARWSVADTHREEAIASFPGACFLGLFCTRPRLQASKIAAWSSSPPVIDRKIDEYILQELPNKGHDGSHLSLRLMRTSILLSRHGSIAAGSSRKSPATPEAEQ